VQELRSGAVILAAFLFVLTGQDTLRGYRSKGNGFNAKDIGGIKE
jgi:hypothetical protein